MFLQRHLKWKSLWKIQGRGKGIWLKNFGLLLPVWVESLPVTLGRITTLSLSGSVTLDKVVHFPLLHFFSFYKWVKESIWRGSSMRVDCMLHSMQSTVSPSPVKCMRKTKWVRKRRGKLRHDNILEIHSSYAVEHASRDFWVQWGREHLLTSSNSPLYCGFKCTLETT